MPKAVFIQPDGTEVAVEVARGESVMRAAVRHAVDGILADCGGALTCSTCHVYVAAEWVDRLPTRDPMEEDMLDFAWQPDPTRSRLTCQIKVTDALDGLRVEMPEKQI